MATKNLQLETKVMALEAKVMALETKVQLHVGSLISTALSNNNPLE